MTAPTTARKPMQTTTVTTMATVSPTDSAAASLKRSCVAAICFLWRSSLSSCKGTLLELRIEAVVTKERIERKKEHTILCSCCFLAILDPLTLSFMMPPDFHSCIPSLNASAGKTHSEMPLGKWVGVMQKGRGGRLLQIYIGRCCSS